MSTIVLVEEIPLIRFKLKRELLALGYNVFDLETWDQLSSHPHVLDDADLLVLSDHFASRDSIQILKTIFSRRSDLPSVLISREFKKDFVQEALKFGVSDFVVKPFEYEDVIERIKRIVPISVISIPVEELLRSELARAQRAQFYGLGSYAVSIMYLDIETDEQQPLENSYQALKQLKELFQNKLRSVDMIFEFGNRLLLLLPFTNKAGVPVVVQKLSESLDDPNLPHFELNYGAASYPEECKSDQEMLELARKRLTERYDSSLLHSALSKSALRKRNVLKANQQKPTAETDPATRHLYLKGFYARGQVRLTWNSLIGAKEYVIKRLINGELNGINYTANTYFVDRELPIEGNYVYQLKAIDPQAETIAEDQIVIAVMKDS